MTETEQLAKEIEEQLDRLDAYDEGQGIVANVIPELPRGWVSVADSGGWICGPAKEILAELQAVQYDPDKIVGRNDPQVCYDPACYGGELPETEEELHGHDGEEYSASDSDTGFEAAWNALNFSQSPPDSHSWPADLIHFEQLEEGTPNDNPLTLIVLQCNGGERFVVGSHGVDSDALADADTFHESREEALAEYYSLRGAP